MELNAELEMAGIDPMHGDCYCFASALQKIVDEKKKRTEILCIKKKPHGEISHCMLVDLKNSLYYDAEGRKDREEAVDKFDEDADECHSDENGDYEEGCYDTHGYSNEFMAKKYCKEGKIGIIERITREVSPSWLSSLVHGEEET